MITIDETLAAIIILEARMRIHSIQNQDGKDAFNAVNLKALNLLTKDP